MTNPERS